MAAVRRRLASCNIFSGLSLSVASLKMMSIYEDKKTAGPPFDSDGKSPFSQPTLSSGDPAAFTTSSRFCNSGQPIPSGISRTASASPFNRVYPLFRVPSVCLAGGYGTAGPQESAIQTLQPPLLHSWIGLFGGLVSPLYGCQRNNKCGYTY
jgi:hypothetical protein